MVPAQPQLRSRRLVLSSITTANRTEAEKRFAPPLPAAPDGPVPNGGGGGRWRTGVGAMVVFTTLASAVNYASNLIFSRILDPTGFGELTALMAFVVFVAVPTGAAQTMLAERIARMRAAGEDEQIGYLLRHAIGHVVVIAGVATVIYTACIPLVVDVFELRQPGPAIALIPVVFTAFLTPLALGALQGMDRYVALGVLILAMALGRIVFGVPWTWAGGGAGGALGGYGVGMAVVLVFSWFKLRHLVIGRGTGAARGGLRRIPDTRTLVAGGAFMAFAVISNLDILLAKIFLEPHETGIYAAMATVAKVVLFLPSAIAVVMVPNAARARHSSGSSSAVLRTTMPAPSVQFARNHHPPAKPTCSPNRRRPGIHVMTDSMPTMTIRRARAYFQRVSGRLK